MKNKDLINELSEFGYSDLFLEKLADANDYVCYENGFEIQQFHATRKNAIYSTY